MSGSIRPVAEEHYSPLYFLASLGAGGLVVTFFMYLMFWVPHPGQPVPVFEDIVQYATSQDLLGQAMVAVALLGIAFMAFMHFKTLIWNLRQVSGFKKSGGYEAIKGTNAESQMKAMPLALAMSVNVGFILGLVFVPGLWNVVEYLFPLAIITFVAIGIFAFRLLGQFFGRVLGDGGFDTKANNSFAQMLPAFALAMVGVGLAAPAAMSQTAWIVGTSLTLSTFFIIAASIIALVAMVLAVVSMVQHGTNPEAAPTLMIVIPLLTVIGIALVRLNHGLHTTFDVHGGAGEAFMLLTKLISVQVLFGLLGLAILRRQKYAQSFLAEGGKRSAGSYALVCPGVGLSVMIHFWVNKGLVATGLIAKFGAAYWIATAPALILQVAMILLVLKLNRMHFGRQSAPAAAVPAE